MSNVALSWSRVEAQAADDMHMAVDEAGVGVPVAPPSNEWMEAARMAADTDGILENASAKRQKVCISGYTLTSPGPCTCKPCTRMHTKERVSPENTSASRTIVQKKMNEKEHPKGLLRLSSALPPKSLPNHCRVTAVALPWHCRGTAEHDALELAALAARGNSEPNTPKRDSNPGPRAGSPGRSPLDSPAGPS